MKSKFILIITIIFLSPTITSGYAISGNYTTVDNNTKDFGDYEGKPLLIEAFSTECSHCIDMHEEMVDIYDEFNNTMGILSLSISSSDTVDTVIEFEKKYPMNWDYGLVNDKQLNEYDVKYTPTMILVDEQGNFVNCWVGTKPSQELSFELNAYISDSDAYNSKIDGEKVCNNPSGSNDIMIYSVGISIILFFVFRFISNRKKIDV